MSFLSESEQSLDELPARQVRAAEPRRRRLLGAAPLAPWIIAAGLSAACGDPVPTEIPEDPNQAFQQMMQSYLKQEIYEEVRPFMKRRTGGSVLPMNTIALNRELIDYPDSKRELLGWEFGNMNLLSGIQTMHYFHHYQEADSSLLERILILNLILKDTNQYLKVPQDIIQIPEKLLRTSPAVTRWSELDHGMEGMRSIVPNQVVSFRSRQFSSEDTYVIYSGGTQLPVAGVPTLSRYTLAIYSRFSPTG